MDFMAELLQMSTANCHIHNLGTIRYQEAWDLQKSLVRKIQEDGGEDTLLLLEHPHVFTIGKNGAASNLLIGKQLLDKVGAEVFHVDRGGDITYHGPGQLVGYSIINLAHYKRDLRWYIDRIEEVLIRTIAHYGIACGRVAGLTGVWVGNEKIAAIGARVSKWVTSHGFALNLNTNLEYFKLIVPCGLQDKGVTSISKLIGKPVEMDEVKAVAARHFGEVFHCRIISDPSPAKELAHAR